MRFIESIEFHSDIHKIFYNQKGICTREGNVWTEESSDYIASINRHYVHSIMRDKGTKSVRVRLHRQMAYCLSSTYRSRHSIRVWAGLHSHAAETDEHEGRMCIYWFHICQQWKQKVLHEIFIPLSDKGRAANIREGFSEINSQGKGY